MKNKKISVYLDGDVCAAKWSSGGGETTPRLQWGWTSWKCDLPCMLGQLTLFLHVVKQISYGFSFFRPHLWHMKVPRLRSNQSCNCWPRPQSRPCQIQAKVCDLGHSSRQCQIFNLLGEAREQTHILMDTSWVLKPLSHDENSWSPVFNFFFFFLWLPLLKFKTFIWPNFLLSYLYNFQVFCYI